MTTLNPFPTKTNLLHNQFIPSFSLSTKPLTSLSFKTPLLLPIKASSSGYPKTPKSLTPLSFLTPTLITTVTATALFFTGLHFNPKKAISIPNSPPPIVDTNVKETVLEDDNNIPSVIARARSGEEATVSVDDNNNVPSVISRVGFGKEETVLEDNNDIPSVNPRVWSGEEEAVLEENIEKPLEEELPINPNEVEILKSLLESRVKNRELVDAFSILDKLIEKQPDEPEWRFLKSHLYVHNGEVELARLGFRDIILKDPYNVDAYRGLVVAVSEDESIEEMRKIERMVEEGIELCVKEKKESEMRDFKLLLAQIWVIQGKYDDALKVYNELVEEEPMDYRPYLCQGIIYTMLKKKDEAEKYFEKYRALVPQEDPNARFEFMMTT